MGEDGALAPAGEIGEVVIRGDNVTAGYENNPKANAEAFRDGWFRTGDQGVLDEDGYLRLTGRLKEIINRGGEKISPREVDEALMDHPAVRASRRLRHAARQASARTSRRRWCCARVRLRPRRNCANSSARGSQRSRFRARSCSSPRSRRARRGSFSGSGSRRSWG